MDPFQTISALVSQAVEILKGVLARAHDETLSFEVVDHIDASIAESFKTTCILSVRLEKLATKIDSNRVIAFLKEKKVDYTLLLYLQLPKSIRSTSESISYLDGVCSNMKIDTTSHYLYKCVWTHFEEEGVSPITPDKYVTATKKNAALEEYESVRKSWGSHNPLFLQTYCRKDGRFADNVYYISRTVQDGIIWLLDILKAGTFVVKGKVYDVCGAFEHVISSTTLTCQIYDCEIMSKAFGDMKSVEEIKEMILCFPQCISSIMIGKDLIDIESIITYVVKDRTRHVAEDNVKVSNHFIGNICAPKHIHRHATDICLSDWKDKIDDVGVFIKSAGLIPESYIENTIYDSILTLDYSAIKSNGFTTAFSRKSQHDPFPLMLFADEICAGDVYARHECLKDPQDLHNPNLSDAQRRMLIHVQLYTTPKKEMLSYKEDAIEAMIVAADESQEKGGAALKPTPRPQRANDSTNPSSTTPSTNLPAWLSSALQEITGQCVSDVRSDLPFLYKLKDTLPNAARGATLYHIPRSWCANSMTKDEGHVHKSNGTVFAVDDSGLVYVTCSTGSGSHKITENNSQCIKVVNMYSKVGEDGKPQQVESVRGKCVHWVMLDEESMGLLVNKVKKSEEPLPKKAKI